MEKKDVVRVLERIASFMELRGENPFRVRAFQNAARTVAGLQGSLPEIVDSGELESQRGIGKRTLAVVKEVASTGQSSLLNQLRAETPEGLVDMLKISGLGVTKVRKVHDELGITTLEELEEAARDGRLAKLPRFGSKTADNVLRGIRYLRRVSDKKLFHHAQAEAEGLVHVLGQMPGVSQAVVAGAIRRRLEVVSELDFVLKIAGSPEQIIDRLGNVEGVSEYRTQSPEVVQLRFSSGTNATVALAAPDAFGYVLARTTAAPDHWGQIERVAHAKHLALPENSRDLQIRCPDEAAFFELLGLQYIPPELREGRGEVEAAARGELPELVAVDDLEGLVHCHTNYSDGTSTVADWAAACRNADYSYVGITDHSLAATYAGGLDAGNIARQHEEIERTNTEYDDFRVLKGVEADILPDGTLDYTPEVKATFDFVIGSIHTQFSLSERDMTDRVLKAMDDPYMAILGHPTGRLLLSRDPYPMDLQAVFDKAASEGVAIEINSDPQRLDLDWRLVRDAVSRGVTVSVGADAHSTQGIGYMELGIGIARKGWLTKDDVLNSRPASEFVRYAQARRTR